MHGHAGALRKLRWECYESDPAWLLVFIQNLNVLL